MISLRCLALAMFAATSCWCADPTITTSTIAKAEVLTVTIPNTWTSSIVRLADRDAFLAKPDRVLINGGYFNAAHQPDALVITDRSTWGRLRADAPYSGFVWADETGMVHIERRTTPPESPAWAIQSGPLLVEGGKSGINTTQQPAPRSVLALKAGQLRVIRTGVIGLKDLADGLVAAGVEAVINLDGGPSADLRVRVGGVATERPGRVMTPYFIGFLPPPVADARPAAR